jgi:hypothetical protein
MARSAWTWDRASGSAALAEALVRRGNPVGGPGKVSYSSGMTTRPPGGRYRLWPAARPYARMLLLSALPVPDLASRHKVRRTAARLARQSAPWPGKNATGTDAARLALLKLLFLQKETRRAVRSRQDEAATMLARTAIETLITGLYCIYEPEAVAQLEGEQVRMLPLLLGFLEEADLLPADVLAECIRRLDVAAPARGPGVEFMAARVDAATSGKMAAGLYDLYYRPTSNLALHAGSASLLRHVRGDGRLSRRPSRVWARRAPARIADTCLGALTAALASRAGVPWHQAVRYADRHGERVLSPVVAISLRGLGRGARPGRLLAAIGQLRALGRYVQSGQDAADPAARAARIRADLESLLAIAELDVPAAALDPFLDYLATKAASEGTAA